VRCPPINPRLHPTVESDSKLLDLDHLSKQTLGNRDLEREVLELFAHMAGEQVERLEAGVDAKERREAAHAIVGSARAIGAFEAARMAGEVERGEEPVDAKIAALAVEIGELRKFIFARLGK
jgi:HPt (histidine-containing phosphotransfer) domain-containing protein